MTRGIVMGALLAGALVVESGTVLALPDEPYCELGCPCSPIVVDVQGNGIKLGPPGVGVQFDLFGNGNPLRLQWVRAGEDDAFLVLDLNANGRIDDGSELFGQGTTIVLTGERATNGFVALQQYDSSELGGNEDGLLTSADAIWPSLRLWTDRNADGESQRGEISSLGARGFTAFETLPKFKPYTDEAGNYVPVYSYATRRPDKQVLMVDVFFAGLAD